MGWPIIRFKAKSGAITWGYIHDGAAFPLDTIAESLSSLLAMDIPSLCKSAAASGKGAALGGLELLSPVTAPCQIICQGKNYLDHLLETGVNYNLLFTKSDSSLSPAVGTIWRPEGVRLLDYELELGLVIRQEISSPISVNDINLHEYVAGLVMANDISARDVQIPERQWFRGKSFRGFCPVGPVFWYMAREEFAFLYELQLFLSVEGQQRQKASTAQLLHRPPETLSLISRSFDLRPGDLLLTGTPGGVSMRVQPKGRIREFLDLWRTDKEKFGDFVEEQAKSGRYLKDWDRIEARIRTAGGEIDLGEQRLVVQG
jgi:2,4-didehydro-3-deoxy-L-rhamnonate hydrolase